MATLKDFKPFYDYSAIETAVQSVFVATGDFCKPAANTDDGRESWTPPTGIVPVYTYMESLVFQQAMPRVAVSFNNVAPVKYMAQAIAVSDTRLLPSLKKGVLTLDIHSDEADPTAHLSLRAYCLSVADGLVPMVPEGTNQLIGVNQYMTSLYAVRFVDNGQTTAPSLQEGYWASSLRFEIQFGWRHDQLPQ